MCGGNRANVLFLLQAGIAGAMQAAPFGTG